jgi:hypothetical protein
MFGKSQHKSTLCRECWGKDKEYVAQKTAKAQSTIINNRIKKGFVRKEDQSYNVTCPKCAKVRKVSYSYYRAKQDNPPLCQKCCNADPENVKSRIAKRIATVKQKHLQTGFIPKSKQKHLVKCKVCGDEREGSYSLVKKTKLRNCMCRKCFDKKRSTVSESC